MARAIWKGSISFGLVEIPVGLYSAETPQELHFHLLDARDHAPVGYQRINKNTGELVEWENIVKGYELDDGRHVLVTDEDFKTANVEATETVDIVEFVDSSEIDSVYYEKPYYLAPLTRGGKAYALLRETLRRTGKVGIARVVIRTRQYAAALGVRGRALVLNLLRYASELRDAEAELELPSDDLRAVGLSDREIELAERLVSGMVATFDPRKYRDQYREDLLALIERKAASGGQQVATTARRKERPGAVIDIMELLQQSVQRTAANQDTAAANTDTEAKPKRTTPRRSRRAAGKK